MIVSPAVLELSGVESGIAYEPFPADDPKQRCPNITRAREVLGWEPKVPACEGLKKTLEWFAGRAGRNEALRPARR